MDQLIVPTDIDDVPLYEPHKKVYPQRISGTFRNMKWGLMAVCLAIYYLVPFIRWDRGPNAPNQAVLVDFPNRRFYFFFVEIWPQEVYYFTGLLIIAAIALFLMNAIGGRIWCGYLCPQTVWTDLYLAVERWIEGDRRERIRKDAAALTPRRVTEKITKHAIWILIAWWTGGAWVLYFDDAPTLAKQLATGEAPLVAYLWIAILTFTTYALAGFMREQVCIYMCPWPRIQAALTDEWALNVTYRYDRGEPRSSLKKALDLRAHGEKAGDCIDCYQCVAVCPTGIDIRDGAQLGCIMCGLCIDACDSVMKKVGRPPRLIAYDTDINIKRRLAGEPAIIRLVRPRTIIYAAVIVIVAGVMLDTLLTRHLLGISVLHDRNPLIVRLSDGSLRNAYAVRILNKQNYQREVRLDVEGLPEARFDIVGGDAPKGTMLVTVGPDQTLEKRVLVTAPLQAKLARSTTITFRITDAVSGETASARDHFLAE